MKQYDESFGVIPLSRARGEWEVFLIQHKHVRYWGFPKGHAETNETHEMAARRELKEETNLDIIRFLQPEPLMEQYQFVIDGRRVFKQVCYFIAEVSGNVVLQQQEVSDGIWLSLPQALRQLTHPEGKSMLRQVEKILLCLES
ncbi:MAG: NUDIX domain-containing protein [Parachlamydia sp.]|nr:NUDIX domain-containing protein [Parachlamydia sp.]